MTITANTTLAQAVDEASARYSAANPASLRRHEAALKVMPGGNTRSVLYHAPFPLAFDSGSGAMLESLDGVRYTDMLGEYTAGLYGHSNPTIMATLHATLDNGISFGGHNDLEGQLAALMCERFANVDSIRFTNSGTESNLMTIATAIAATGRSKILVFSGAYHGSVLSFGGGGSPVNVPHDFVVGTYNDVDGTRALLREVSGELAAVLVEPMLGSGGCIPGSREFLTMLREETAQSGAVLIFDEVMTSRVAPGGLQQLVGISPDLTSFGKYLGGGMSFGAFGGRRDLMALYDPTVPGALPHAGTFNNNVLTMAAGIVGLREILDAETTKQLNDRGDRLRDALNAVFRRRGVAMQVTGVGSIMTIHFVKNPIHTPADLMGSDPLAKELLFLDLVADGFWMAARAMIALSLAITDADCDRFVDSVEAFALRHRALLDQ